MSAATRRALAPRCDTGAGGARAETVDRRAISRRHHYQWHAPSTPERMSFLASASPEEAADTGEGNGDWKIRRNCSCRGDHLCHDYEGAAVGFWTLLSPQCRQCHAKGGP